MNNNNNQENQNAVLNAGTNLEGNNTSNINNTASVSSAPLNGVTATSPAVNKPQVVESVENVKEVDKVATPETNSNGSNHNNDQTPNDNKNKKKSGHPIFLVILIIFLFVFVFFLPQITDFITDYKNKKSGANDLKSGTMVCKMTLNAANINYEYSLTFKYTENKLKSSSAVTTSRLADNATDSSILTSRQEDCLALKNVVDEHNIGMNTSCEVTAAMQRTTQDIDYTTLDLDFITTNIAEFGGFYPEYELDQSARAIEKELTNSGYTCQKNEY